MTPVRNQGLLAEIPPGVLYYGSIWVLIADGIFSGMAAHARLHDLVLGILCAVVTVAVLAASSVSRRASVAMSLVLAATFGALVYSISSILLLAAIVLVQIGLMHFVAFAILRSHWKEPVQRFLKERREQRS